MGIIIEVDHRKRDVGIIKALRVYDDVDVEEKCLLIVDYPVVLNGINVISGNMRFDRFVI